LEYVNIKLVKSFSATLTGAQKVPSNHLIATGRLAGVLSLDNYRFDYVLYTTGLTNITTANFELASTGQIVIRVQFA